MSDQPLRVVVVGAAGRMGLETVRALSADREFEVVGVVGRSGAGQRFRDLLPEGPDFVLESKLAATLDRTKPDVVVDYAHYSAAADHAEQCVKRRVSFVFGMTGISDQDLRAISDVCKESGVPGMVVPNFAIGAVLMMRFAEIAAKWIPDCEIIEMHHDRKEDAPSGTAVLTAQRISASRSKEPTRLPRPTLKVEGARGGIANGVPVHSVRLPGLLAHQMVIFGAKGEVLTLRHDSLERSGFMEGVKLCVRQVGSLNGLTIGMYSLLFTYFLYIFF
jgi:4-hydroxy-tetrahydrodipicolinate reductase